MCCSVRFASETKHRLYIFCIEQLLTSLAACVPEIFFFSDCFFGLLIENFNLKGKWYHAEEGVIHSDGRI